MQKVAVIGAGNVGGMAAMRIVERNIADVILIDVVKNIAQAKALDIEDSLGILKINRKISGSDDFALIRDSDVVVITAGLARKPGMSREELSNKNSQILRDVSFKIKDFSPNSIIIVVTNPVDIMTYLVYRSVECKPNRIFGMGSNLDTGRFVNLIAKKLNVKNSSVKALVMAAHGEGMVPLSGVSKAGFKDLGKFLDEDNIAALKLDTINRGAQIVELYGAGSAYFAPSMAIAELVEAVIRNEKKIFPVSCYLDGEYGFEDLFIGVPAVIGRRGVHKIIELELDFKEKEAFSQAARSIRRNI